jgi:16S rRNA (cytosine967-C5)-methyltransferase
MMTNPTQAVASEALYVRQVDTILTVFEMVDRQFHDRKPIDRVLSGVFRSGRKYGSRDRKRISAAIFGYYRWRGWIDELAPEDPRQALLLGYLFDSNPVDGTIHYWARSCGFDDLWLTATDLRTAHERLSWIRQRLSGCGHHLELKKLVPPCAGNWSEERIAAMQSRPNLWVRSEAGRQPEILESMDRQHIQYRVYPACPNTIEILSPVNLNEFRPFRQGYLEVQDIGSQAVGLVCCPEPGQQWWDVCAGSGGKALHLSSLMAGSGTVIATETARWKFKELQRRTRRLASRHNIVPILWDGSDKPVSIGRLDGILIDAPCSCSGTWRRAPDLRWTTTPETIARFRQVQIQLLLSCCRHLNADGILVYATCSLFPEENEQVTALFLAHRPDYRMESMICPFDGTVFHNGLYLTPPRIDGNGMYVARMRRI